MFKFLRIGFFCSLLLQTVQVLAYRAKQRRSTLFSPMLLTALVLSLTVTGVCFVSFFIYRGELITPELAHRVESLPCLHSTFQSVLLEP